MVTSAKLMRVSRRVMETWSIKVWSRSISHIFSRICPGLEKIKESMSPVLADISHSPTKNTNRRTLETCIRMEFRLMDRRYFFCRRETGSEFFMAVQLLPDFIKIIFKFRSASGGHGSPVFQIKLYRDDFLYGGWPPAENNDPVCHAHGF